MFDHTRAFDGMFIRILSPISSLPRGQSGRVLRRGIGVLALLVGMVSVPASGQINPQVGGGLQMVGSTAEGSVGPGLFVRGSFPLTRDVSLAAGTAGTGYVLEGGDDARYVLDLEAAAIVTLPSPTKSANYLMGGWGSSHPISE